MGHLHFYFDFISPYAYLAWKDVVRRAQTRGDDVVLEPILFAALLKHHGQLGPAEMPAKRRWLVRDTIRRADRLGVPFTFPAHHPFRPLTALRLSLPRVAGTSQHRVVAALFEHGWQNGGDLGDDVQLARALDASGLPGDELVAKTRDPGTKAELAERSAAAIERGVFGVPTLAVGDELFWGSDRVDDAFDHLEGRGLIDETRVAAALERTASAERKR